MAFQVSDIDVVYWRKPGSEDIAIHPDEIHIVLKSTAQIRERTVTSVDEIEEYQAVFSYPLGDEKTYGSWNTSLEAALRATPKDPGYLSGIRIREVSPPRDLPLRTVVHEARDLW